MWVYRLVTFLGMSVLVFSVGKGVTIGMQTISAHFRTTHPGGLESWTKQTGCAWNMHHVGQALLPTLARVKLLLTKKTRGL